jgi:hypothetical protein
LAGTPTCNIVGFISGYTGEGTKNILPTIAVAKLDFRLIPDMMPQEQFERMDLQKIPSNPDVEKSINSLKPSHINKRFLISSLIARAGSVLSVYLSFPFKQETYLIVVLTRTTPNYYNDGNRCSHFYRVRYFAG